MKFKQEYIIDYFHSFGCELLSKCNDAEDLLDVKCKCGNIYKISFRNFRRKGRLHQCGECRYKGLSNAFKLNYNYVHSFFAEQGCELLESEYINAHIKMKYRCSCGNISCICFDSFKQGNRCKKCGVRKNSGDKQRYTQEKVTSDFKAGRCELLGNYTKSNVKMPYRCECGNISEITYSNFIKGRRCKECHIKNITGKNNYQWREDREQLRLDLSFRQRCYKVLQYMIKRGIIEKKEARTKSYLGYDWVELKEHIESFPEWVFLKDQEWHLDHIFPIQAFLDYGIKDVKLINSLGNLRPTTPEENISKNDKYNKEEFEKYLERNGYKYIC